MQKVVLDNGLKVIFEKKKGTSVVVELMVKVGSNDENSNEKGISHIIEHLLFEGTKKRPTNRKISNEIEKIGGEFNAYTTHERTCFYVKVLKKHFSIAIDVLSDILNNSLILEKTITKEKKIIMKEIDMVIDDPRYYQWTLFQKTLFDKHPTKWPAYGDKKIVKSFERKKIMEYFKKYYVPNNMVISVVGDVNNWKSEIKNNFQAKKAKSIKKKIVKEPKQTKNKKKVEKKSIASTYAVLGYKTIPRSHSDSYVLEVIDAILGRGQSGLIFNEIRSKKGLAYDVGTESVSEKSYGYFAIYVGLDKKNLSQAKKIILQEIEKLKEVKNEDLKEAKDYIEGDYLLSLEDSQKLADQLLFWEQCKDAKVMREFIRNIKKVTTKDIKRVVNKYFKYHTLAVVEKK
jgi:predicted Zn-dependent peptidase